MRNRDQNRSVSRSKSKERASLSVEKVRAFVKDGKLVMLNVVNSVGQVPSLKSFSK
jgi:hypothetical protein